MKIALLGYGKECRAVEKYFKNHCQDLEIDIFDNLTPAEIANEDYSSYDLVFRSPSIPPMPEVKNFTSVTRYFLDHCPCPIIGITGTKGKGSTCAFTEAILKKLNEDVYLVGNMDIPAIEVLDQLTEHSIVIYEMSSFQLWDITKSPHVAVIGNIEPDHLNVHPDFDDYVNAKANIGRFQTPDDYMIYYTNDQDSVKAASISPAQKILYPFPLPDDIAESINIPGAHNQANAAAAIAAVASYKHLSSNDFIKTYSGTIKQAFKNFKGLPHRLQFIRQLNNVKYYDDCLSTNPVSTRAAIDAFPDYSVIAIVGGRDKTHNEDIPEICEIITKDNVKKVVLIGESGHELYNHYHDARFVLAESLEEAIATARKAAETYENAIVLMSPSAASFDMFKNAYDRGEKYQIAVKSLK